MLLSLYADELLKYCLMDVWAFLEEVRGSLG